MNLIEVPLGRHAPGIINVIIEVPKGSNRRYEYNARRRRFYVSYKLSISMPADCGWIPEAIGEDSDRLDAMVIARHPTRPGYICQARPIGTLKQKDGDHKVICVLLGDEKYEQVQDVSDLESRLIRKLVAFFEPFFEFDGWYNRAETCDLIKRCHDRYVEVHGKKLPERSHAELTAAVGIVPIVDNVRHDDDLDYEEE